MEHFNHIIRLLLKNAQLLIALPIAAMALLWYLTKDQPRKFEVKSKFLYDFDGKSTSVSGESLNQQEIYTEFLNTLEIIRSNKLAEKVKSQVALESLNGTAEVFAYDWPTDQQKDIEQLLQAIIDDQRSPYLDQSDLSQIIQTFYRTVGISSEGIQNAIHARRLHSSNFLEISMTYHHPAQLFYMSNLLNQLLVKEMESINKKNIGKQKAIIEELVRKAKAELDAKVQELEELKVNNNIINLAEHTKAIVTYQVQLEQMRADLNQQLASAKRAETTIKDGIDQREFAAVDQQIQTDVLRHKEELYTAQDLKVVHLQKDIDYEALLEQQRIVNANSEGIRKNLEDLSRASIYDASQVHTDLTMQYIDYKVQVDKVQDELRVLLQEIERVKHYAAYFAPFESAISTLRDEINTAQHSYLLFLNKLNITESLEVGATRNKLELVDHPQLPLKPLPSKTKLVIVAGGMGVGLLLVAFIIINYLLDNRIKDVRTFERRMQRSVVAALPSQIGKKSDPVLKKALNMLNKEGIKKIAREIDNQKCIAINSLSNDDDVTKLVQDLKRYWKKEKVGVLTLTGDRDTIVDKIAIGLRDHDRLICLSSPLQFSYDGITVAESTECGFLHFRLGRLKMPADDRLLQDYERLVGKDSQFILSDLQPDYMDSYVGEVPKQRNKIRQIAKKLINRDFSWKSS